jgi:hypothetical protein
MTLAPWKSAMLRRVACATAATGLVPARDLATGDDDVGKADEPLEEIVLHHLVHEDLEDRVCVSLRPKDRKTSAVRATAAGISRSHLNPVESPMHGLVEC